MTYDILATGSTGNSVVINGEILIDCGVPMKLLRDSGYVKGLRLVLLTHQHSDHFNASTVRALHKERPALRWCGCEWMVPQLLQAGVDKRAIMIIDAKRWYQCGFSLQFKAEPLPHDVPNCGYHIKMRQDECYETLFYSTDCGTLDGIEAKGYDLYMLESNHTRAEIEARASEKQASGEFAYEYRAAKNHLSYEQVMEWLAQNAGPKSKYVLLHQHKESKKPLDNPRKMC